MTTSDFQRFSLTLGQCSYELLYKRAFRYQYICFISDWQHFDEEVGEALLLWIYTDQISLDQNDEFILQIMKIAASFRLSTLVNR